MTDKKLLLDENGNVNIDRLSKELQSALDFDVKYKQTDSMKKRAVKVATSYDEFKAMVACAHLKKLTRKEVETLSNVKKGWIKKAIKSDTTASANILTEEENMEETIKVDENFVKKASKAKSIPKNAMELERDLRRLRDNTSKFRCLSKIGQETLTNLLNRAGDVDLIEEILRIVFAQCASSNLNEGDDTSKVEETEILSWFTAISECNKFGLTLKFADKSLLNDIYAYIEARDSTLAANFLNTNKS